MEKQKGFTLVELMIGIVIGLIILIGAGGFFQTTLRANAQSVKQQRFEQTVQILMNLMSAEIRRAGYAKAGITLTNQSNGNNYFPNDACVLLSHSTATENEKFYGFKLVNNVVYSYSGLANTTSLCTGVVTDWTPLTDINHIKVTRLWFDHGKVDLTANYDCVADPIAGAEAVPRLTLAAEAVGLNVTGSTPVKRCEQVNVARRNI